MVTHEDPYKIAEAIGRLSFSGIYSDANRNTMMDYPHFNKIYNACWLLDRLALLSQDNFLALTNHGNIEGVLLRIEERIDGRYAPRPEFNQNWLDNILREALRESTIHTPQPHSR